MIFRIHAKVSCYDAYYIYNQNELIKRQQELKLVLTQMTGLCLKVLANLLTLLTNLDDTIMKNKGTFLTLRH